MSTLEFFFSLKKKHLVHSYFLLKAMSIWDCVLIMESLGDFLNELDTLISVAACGFLFSKVVLCLAVLIFASTHEYLPTLSC